MREILSMIAFVRASFFFISLLSLYCSVWGQWNVTLKCTKYYDSYRFHLITPLSLSLPLSDTHTHTDTLSHTPTHVLHNFSMQFYTHTWVYGSWLSSCERPIIYFDKIYISMSPDIFCLNREKRNRCAVMYSNTKYTHKRLKTIKQQQ